jgi:hypothetical protein
LANQSRNYLLPSDAADFWQQTLVPRLLIVYGADAFWADVSRPMWTVEGIREAIGAATYRQEDSAAFTKVVFADSSISPVQFKGRQFAHAWSAYVQESHLGRAGFELRVPAASRQPAICFPERSTSPMHSYCYYGSEFFGKHGGGRYHDDAWRSILSSTCDELEFDGWWHDRGQLRLTDRLKRGDASIVCQPGEDTSALLQEIVVVTRGEGRRLITRRYEVPRVIE